MGKGNALPVVAGVLVVAGAVGWGVLRQEDGNAPYGPRATEETHVPAISDYATDPYTKQGYPKTFAAWGEDWVARINEVRALAAPLMAANPTCDKLDVVELSDNRSKVRESIVVFGDCVNLVRFYMTEGEVREGTAARSQAEKAAWFDETAMIESCTAALRERLALPASLDRDAWSLNVWQATTTGNWVIEFDFTAQNALGMELPASVRCVVTPERELSLEIVE